MFQKCDRDRSGTLDFDEFLRCLRASLTDKAMKL